MTTGDILQLVIMTAVCVAFMVSLKVVSDQHTKNINTMIKNVENLEQIVKSLKMAIDNFMRSLTDHVTHCENGSCPGQQRIRELKKDLANLKNIIKIMVKVKK